jgi:hypothetical protein
VYGAEYNQAIGNYQVFYGLDEATPQVQITVIAPHPGKPNLPLIIRLYGRLTGGDIEHGTCSLWLWLSMLADGL